MERLNEYVEALEEERRKIRVFKSELPLCLELVTQAIDACRQQMSGTTTECHHAQSDCSEKTSGYGPVFEEFIPVKRTSSTDEDEQQSDNPNNNSVINYDNEKSSQKSDWLRSVQLWSHTPDPPLQEEVPRKESVMEVKGNSPGVFHAFESEKSVGTAQALMGSSTLSVAPMARSSTLETDGSSGGGNGSKKEEKGGQSQKKSRRSWSPELHKLFLHALQQLGGSHVATPKQIRELMNVDGLTNDEVKSHLQKYRLHTRRPNSSLHNNNPRAPPQFVVVRGIWVQPPEYTAVTEGEASKVDASNGMYAPVLAAAPVPLTQESASLIQPRQHKQSKPLHSDQKGSHRECRVHSNSSSTSTSSSTHTGPSSRVLVPVL